MSDQQTQLLKVEIDGQVLEVPPGTSIIKAADDAGIYIPRFCYHKKLSVAANCRMCLVEIEGGRKPMPACSTPVNDGMKVFTKSPKAMQYQKSVMEFLLINHPLDCPICDQGGECELQDMAMGYGDDVSRYNQGKRAVADKDIGPLIETDLTRCIHCTRCVRFTEEVAGYQELGMINRGESSEIATFLENNIESEMSGNVIDLCPVGALTNKPFRYQARAWEMVQCAQVSPHDCVGSNMYAHVRRHELMRVVPRENELLNEIWLADRDRYGHFGLYHQSRLKQPMVKRDGEWEAVSWETAMEVLASKFKRILDQNGPKQVGALASPSATTEELYLLQKLMRALKVPHIDHRIHTVNFDHQDWWATHPGLDLTLSELQHSDHILVIGGNVRKDQPIVHHRIRQASLNGAQASVINPADFDFRFDVAHQVLAEHDALPQVLASLVKALYGAKIPGSVKALVGDVTVPKDVKTMASALKKSQYPVVLAGQFVAQHPESTTLFALIQLIHECLQARGGLLTTGANTAGAWLAGAVPHRGVGGQKVTAGRHAGSMLTGKALKAYLLLNLEPEFDGVYGHAAMKQLSKADFVVSLTPYFGAGTQQYADMVLPIATYAETAGTYINAMGEWQSFKGVAKQVGESRPAWKVLRVIANFMDVSGFDYVSNQEVLQECRDQITVAKAGIEAIELPKALPKTSAKPQCVSYVPIYAVDGIVRRSAPLQATHDANVTAMIHPELAKKLALESGDMLAVTQGKIKVKLPVQVSEGIAKHNVLLPIGVPETMMFEQSHGNPQLAKG